MTTTLELAQTKGAIRTLRHTAKRAGLNGVLSGVAGLTAEQQVERLTKALESIPAKAEALEAQLAEQKQALVEAEAALQQAKEIVELRAEQGITPVVRDKYAAPVAADDDEEDEDDDY